MFNGNSASIKNLTAQSGGGTVTIGGFAIVTDTLRFGLRANAANVRVRVQEGVSVKADANVNVTGTAQSSVLSGTVTVTQVTYAPQSDIGSILSRAARVRKAFKKFEVLEHRIISVRYEVYWITARSCRAKAYYLTAVASLSSDPSPARLPPPSGADGPTRIEPLGRLCFLKPSTSFSPDMRKARNDFSWNRQV
jgi:hypothetical protein